MMERPTATGVFEAAGGRAALALQGPPARRQTGNAPCIPPAPTLGRRARSSPMSGTGIRPWTVTWYEDGDRKGAMSRRQGSDPLAVPDPDRAGSTQAPWLGGPGADGAPVLCARVAPGSRSPGGGNRSLRSRLQRDGPRRLVPPPDSNSPAAFPISAAAALSRSLTRITSDSASFSCSVPAPHARRESS
jgi:hypothetical protein